MSRSKLSQQLAVVDKLDPVSQAAATILGTAVDMKLHRKLVYIVDVGVFGASATVDVKLQSSATSGGTYADISGKAITQLLAAGGNNRLVKLEVSSQELPSGSEFVKISITVGTAATLLSYVGLADSDRYEPANLADLAAVAQTVS